MLPVAVGQSNDLRDVSPMIVAYHLDGLHVQKEAAPCGDTATTPQMASPNEVPDPARGDDPPWSHFFSTKSGKPCLKPHYVSP